MMDGWINNTGIDREADGGWMERMASIGMMNKVTMDGTDKPDECMKDLQQMDRDLQTHDGRTGKLIMDGSKILQPTDARQARKYYHHSL